MRKNEIAKKYGIIAIAAALAVSGAAPAVCAADIKAQNLAESDSKMQIMAKDAQTGEKSDAADRSDQEPNADDNQDTGKNAESEGLEITEKVYTHDYKTKDGKVYKKISFKYPEASGGSEAAETFNNFYKKLLSKWKKAAKENLKDAKSLIQEREDDVCYTDEVSYEITHNDKDYVSILSSGYDYELGAHGMPYRYTYIFDTATGKKVSAAKLLGISKKQLNVKVRSLYLEQFDKDPESGFYPSREDVQSALELLDFNKNNYYLKDGKICFYADPYVVGPYAAGFMEVSIEMAE